MEEIDLKEMFHYFWQKKLIVIFCVLLALLIALVYGLFIEVPKYQSYTKVLLTTDNEQITTSDITLNNNLVDNYREIIKSNNVMNKVISNLNLSYTTSALKKNISVESVDDTDAIKITVTDTDPELAKDIATVTTEIFKSEVVTYYNLENIKDLDTAEVNTNPVNMNLVKEIIIAILVGFVLSFGMLFVIYYFDNTIKSSEEIERKLGIPVVGIIPLEEEK